LVAARFDRRRRTDIKQHFDHFGGEDLLVKLWLLPWCPGTARHHSPVALGDRRCLDGYLVRGIDDCSLDDLLQSSERGSGMALARCEICGHPKGLKQNYTHFHTPASSVSDNVLCGSPSCTRRAFLWLTEEEEQRYLRGERFFRVAGRGVEVEVQ
jgi:hypothetical protein